MGWNHGTRGLTMVEMISVLIVALVLLAMAAPRVLRLTEKTSANDAPAYTVGPPGRKLQLLPAAVRSSQP